MNKRKKILLLSVCESSSFSSLIIQDFSEIGPYLVAMSNTEGGRLFVGMDLANYHLIGSDDFNFINDLFIN